MKKITSFIILISLFGCKDIIEVNDISQDTITIIAPTNNARLDEPNIRFSWELLDFADSYQLQIVTPDFNEALQVVEDTIVDSSDFFKTLEPNTYQWRVRGLNSAFQTQYKTQTFTIEE